VTIGEETHDKLRYAQSLLGHAVPSGDLAGVLDRALDALIPKLEQRLFAASTRPRLGRRSKNVRHVPAQVRRAVWQRDGGQCTFVSDSGHRCEARTRLEFDHVDPVARGGETTADNMRLRCRAHNQYAAERQFGEAFMRGKRESARARAAERRARRAAARCEAIPGASLEERVRVALSSLAPARVRRPAEVPSSRGAPATSGGIGAAM
jgi:5-methylcytosine-specific restriction endonuclease McrA